MSKEDFMLLTEENIAFLLRDERDRKGYSVEQVAEKLRERGISISTKALYGYENKVGKPKLSTFLALCDIYGITDILAALGFNYPVPVSRSDDLTPDERELIELYRRASSDDQELIRHILKKYENPAEQAPASAG